MRGVHKIAGEEVGMNEVAKKVRKQRKVRKRGSG